MVVAYLGNNGRGNSGGGDRGVLECHKLEPPSSSKTIGRTGT